MAKVKEFVVIYQKSNGGDASKKFATPKQAFEFFWKCKGKSPMITSDEIMGGFTFRNIQGFKSREEGKEFAYGDFLEYVEHNRV
jgi:hypothetical protein